MYTQEYCYNLGTEEQNYIPKHLAETPQKYPLTRNKVVQNQYVKNYMFQKVGVPQASKQMNKHKYNYQEPLCGEYNFALNESILQVFP